MKTKFNLLAVLLFLFPAIWYSCSKTNTTIKNNQRNDASVRTDLEQKLMQAPEWKIVGSMSISRQRHIAVLLPDGTVLVAGGLTTNDATTASAERYNPSKDKWTQIPDMIISRSRHTATLLKDGRVLVVGGRSSDGFTSLRAVEIFDPRTGAWSLTGELNLPRDTHTATLLNDGRVLVCGGLSLNGPSHDAEKTGEIYDPQTGTWTLTDHMFNARWGHQAVLLSNGNVLVCGGSNAGLDCGSQQTAEIYNIQTKKWEMIKQMNTPRGFHFAAVLSDGNVLVAGGFTNPPDCSTLTASAEIFNARTGQWQPTGNLNFERGFIIPGTLLTNGKVLIAGGRIYTNTGLIKTGSTELYNPADGTWSITAGMHDARTGHAITLLNDGRVLVTGGKNDTSVLTSAEVYSQ